MRYIMLLFTLIALSAPADSRRTFVASTLLSPPYVYINEGQVTGIAVAVVDEMFRRIGNYRVDYIVLPWKRAVMKAAAGEADMLFYAAENQQRKAWAEYIDTVLIETRFVLFKLKSRKVSVKPDFSDAKAYSVGVRRGYIYQKSLFLDAINKRRFNAVVESGSTAQSVALLNRGRIDFFIGDYLPVMHYLSREGLTEQIDTVTSDGGTLEIFNVPTFILLSKQGEAVVFRQQLFQALEAMKADGTYDRLVHNQSYHE